jgi:hypothetical protein
MIRFNVEKEGDKYVIGMYLIGKDTSGSTSTYLSHVKDDLGNKKKFWTQEAAQERVNILTREYRDES